MDLPVVLLLALFIVGSFYLLWKLMKVLSEVIVLYRIFTGADTHRSTSRPLRLYTYVCEPRYMDEVSINELYQFVKADFDDTEGSTPDEDIQDLQAIFLSYSYIFLFRDKIDGSLRGMFLLGYNRSEEHTTIQLGVSIFKNYYMGGPYIYLAMGYIVLRELILHPFTPLYIVGMSFSYRSYLVAARFPESYPRYDRETPEFYKKMLKEYALGSKAKLNYNEETCVLAQKRRVLRGSLLPVTEQDLQNPHIKYFVEHNPGYTHGDCLVCGWRMNWSDLMIVILVAGRKMFKQNKSKKVNSAAPRRETVLPATDARSKTNLARRRNKQPPKLIKRYTFQELSANAYAVNMYEMDMFGEPVLSPTHNFAFQSQIPSTTPTASPTEMQADLSSVEV